MSDDTILTEAQITQWSGVEQLQAIVDGVVGQPTMAPTLAFRLVAVSEGRAVFLARPGPSFLNPSGTMHGGWASAVLDSALGCAVHSTLSPGERFATLELKVNLTRAITPGTGELTAVGTLVTRGRRAATSEARLTDDGGRIYAHGTSTCLIVPAGG